MHVHAVGLNHLDTWVRRGVPGHTFPLPLVTSSDASGVVDALGDGDVIACGRAVDLAYGVSGDEAEALADWWEPVVRRLLPDPGDRGDGLHGSASEIPTST